MTGTKDDDEIRRLRQENIAIREENIRLEQEKLGLMKEKLGLQQENIRLEQEKLDFQQEKLGLKQENIRLLRLLNDATANNQTNTLSLPSFGNISSVGEEESSFESDLDLNPLDQSITAVLEKKCVKRMSGLRKNSSWPL